MLNEAQGPENRNEMLPSTENIDLLIRPRIHVRLAHAHLPFVTMSKRCDQVREAELSHSTMIPKKLRRSAKDVAASKNRAAHDMRRSAKPIKKPHLQGSIVFGSNAPN
jgi:hypothetical protein